MKKYVHVKTVTHEAAALYLSIDLQEGFNARGAGQQDGVLYASASVLNQDNQIVSHVPLGPADVEEFRGPLERLKEKILTHLGVKVVETPDPVKPAEPEAPTSALEK